MGYYAELVEGYVKYYYPWREREAPQVSENHDIIWKEVTPMKAKKAKKPAKAKIKLVKKSTLKKKKK